MTVKSDIMELKTLIQQLSQAVQDTGNDLLEKVARVHALSGACDVLLVCC